MAHELPAASRSALCDGLAALHLPEALAGPLLAYLALLLRWNKAYNLTAIRDPQAMVTRHLLDSLALAAHLVDVSTLADLGTGPGLPGIPLALSLPDVRVTLVEANGKKVRFLREVVRTLALANVDVVQSRIEAFNPPRPFAAITARALGSLADLIRLGGHLLAADGRFLAMKGTRPDDEIAALPPDWRVGAIHPLRIPGLDAQRHLLVMTRAVARIGA